MIYVRIYEKVDDLLNYEDRIDVIVNAWNQNFIPHRLLITHGVSKAIKQKSGLKPFDELQKHHYIPLGTAVLTSAGNLKCKGIIHVAGINVFWQSSEKAIRLSIKNTLTIMEENNFKSMAIPLIGCGNNKFSEDECISIIKEELMLKSNLDIDVYIIQYKKTN